MKLIDLITGRRRRIRTMPITGSVKVAVQPIRGHPVAKRPQLKAGTLPMPAVPLGLPQRALIDRRDMAVGVDWKANEWRPIAVFKVPQGTMYRIPEGEPVRLYIKAKASGSSVDNSGGGSAVTTTVNVPGIVQTKMRAVSLPSANHPEVVAWATVSGARQKVPVQAIDYAAETVTLSVPAGESWADITVYYIHGDGEFRIRAQRELGNADTTAALLMDGSFGAIHTVSQIDDEEAPIWPRRVTLWDSNRLVLEVRTGIRIDWTDEAEHLFQVEAYVLQVKVQDKGALRRLAEIDWREGI